MVKNVLFVNKTFLTKQTPVFMLKLKQRFIHYISITCTNLCGNISRHAVYAKTSCKNVETVTPMKNQPFLFHFDKGRRGVSQAQDH